VKRSLAFALLAALVLGACTHARVVQREPGAYRVVPPPPRPAISPLPRDGVHVVQRGETMYGISFRYGLNYRDVAAWNGIPDPYLIAVGQRLRLTPSRGAPSPPRPVATTPKPPVPRPVQPSTQPSTQPTRPVTSPPPVASATTQPAPVAPRPVTPTPTPAPAPVAPPPSPVAITGAPAWQWPTQGELVGRFVTGDQTRQGVDIAGKSGQDVRAAADGVVVYSGAGLVGYGELIIVKHSEEWLSAYAHNQQRLVGEGTRVSAGQVIAKLGRTGAPRDMLHFEIRRNGKPVDPLGLLPRR
jgi:lipoprotein NlpD